MECGRASTDGSAMMKVLLLGSRVVLGTVFIASGILKLTSPDKAVEFIESVLSMDLEASWIVIVLTSIFEIALGAAFLLLTERVRLAALISGSMMLVFTSIGVVEIGSAKSCGCFGDLFDSKTDEFFLARNLVLLIISMFLVRYHPHSSR
jgi:uncharacterized membrane protein YphA (DoxX/SURF4 family)